MPKKKEFNFEASLEELDTLVETMEAGDLSLEESLKTFERGVTLTRECQQALHQAEQKIEILLEQHAEAELALFGDDIEFDDDIEED